MRAVRHPVEMDEELRSTPVRNREHQVRLEAGYRQFPLDANVYVHVDRMMGPVGDDGARGLLGHLIEMDVLNSVHSHIEIKLYRGDGLAVLVDGVEVYSWKKVNGGSSRVRSKKSVVSRRAISAKKKAIIDDGENDDDFEFE